MGRHIRRSAKEYITAIKVVSIVLITIVCFLFGLATSISNTGEAVVAFNQNSGAVISPSPGSSAAEVSGQRASTAASSPVTGAAPASSSIPAGSAAQVTTGSRVRTGKRSPLLPLDTINGMYSEYGSMIVAGMKPGDYDKAMSIEWRALDTPGEPEDYAIDLADLMDYSAVESYILNLGRYEGVEASVIGKSEQGRNIYMVRVDFENKEAPVQNKPVIMLTGNVHAREFAGAEYMIKFLSDTIKKAGSDAYTRMLLENVTIVAVPLVNPDGREMIIGGGNKNRKSNANGVDLNRAMPSANAGQLAKDTKREKELSTKPGLAFFAGYNLGSESETQAMIKWFNHYVPQADLYIDLHQQGGITYFDKTFLSQDSDSLSKSYAILNNKMLHNGYKVVQEKESYGMRGSGGTFTDYARSVSEGLVFSYSLGLMALDLGGVEKPLIFYKDADNYKEYIKPLNADLKCICIEIGRSPGYLGAGEKARQRRKNEYNKYGWDNFLAGTIENVLGKDKTESLKAKASA